MKKGFRFEIAPTMEQKLLLNQYLGTARFVYNNALAKTINEYKLHKEDPTKPKPNVSSNGLADLATSLREEFDFVEKNPQYYCSTETNRFRQSLF